MSKESAKTIEPGTVLTKRLPKQFPNESSYSFAVVAGSTTEITAETAFMAQFISSICLAVSLKFMWNLMHVM